MKFSINLNTRVFLMLFDSSRNRKKRRKKQQQKNNNNKKKKKKHTHKKNNNNNKKKKTKKKKKKKNKRIWTFAIRICSKRRFRMTRPSLTVYQNRVDWSRNKTNSNTLKIIGFIVLYTFVMLWWYVQATGDMTKWVYTMIIYILLSNSQIYTFI